MNLVLYPAVEPERLQAIIAASGSARLCNAVQPDEAMAHLPDADAFFGKITPELLAVAPRLRWVQAPTASLEHYLFPALVEHPCILTNMRGLFSDVIADQVLGYVLCFCRNLHRYVLQQARGLWAPVGGEQARVAFVTGPAHVSAMDVAHRHVADQTLGVVGLGAIGREIARRARAFGMRVVAVDPTPGTIPEGVETVWPTAELARLLEVSDFVVIAAPHTPETEGWFCRPLFQQMKRTAYLINIGRGAIVVLADLVAALEAGELAGAALDVFEVEPLPADSPLWRMGDRVILTPHVAGYSPRIAERHLGVLLENLRRFAAGQPLVNVVDKRRWY
ncbi:MAG: D-2-hydroxyacid dehydrogenase [Gemmataceae bacterium]